MHFRTCAGSGQEEMVLGRFHAWKGGWVDIMNIIGEKVNIGRGVSSSCVLPRPGKTFVTLGMTYCLNSPLLPPGLVSAFHCSGQTAHLFGCGWYILATRLHQECEDLYVYGVLDDETVFMHSIYGDDVSSYIANECPWIYRFVYRVASQRKRAYYACRAVQ